MLRDGFPLVFYEPNCNRIPPNQNLKRKLETQIRTLRPDSLECKLRKMTQNHGMRDFRPCSVHVDTVP